MDFSLFHLGTPGEGKGYPLQYSDLENSMDYVVHGVAKSQTRLSDFHFTSFRNTHLGACFLGADIHLGPLTRQ